MRSLALSVAAAAVEDVLDRVIELAPHGVHELDRDGETELLMFGEMDELPVPEDVSRLCGDLVRSVTLREAPDSWQERRRQTYRPLVVAGRIAVRPEWAPPAPGAPIDLVLVEQGSFGSGAHPTTRACLELLAAVPPVGALADLGCGSGVLAIAAALLGWSPVIAVDSDPGSIEAAATNAERNGVELDLRRLDLAAEPVPPAETLVANVPLAVHEQIAARLPSNPQRVIASGVAADEAEAMVDAYGAAGLGSEARRLEFGWAVVAMVGPA